MAVPSLEVLAPGTTLLGDYRIERKLETDGVAATYLALDPRRDGEVTISEYLPGEWGARGEDGSVGPRSDDVAGLYDTGLERFLARRAPPGRRGPPPTSRRCTASPRRTAPRTSSRTA